MEPYNEVFRSKINEYFKGETTKDGLGMWAKKQYYEILCGDYLRIDKLVFYKYLKIISKFHINPNDFMDEYPSSEETVYEIKEIINGNKTDLFSGKIKIQKRFYESMFLSEKFEDFIKLKKIIIHFIKTNQVLKGSEQIIRDIINHSVTDVVSLIDLLEIQIVSILRNTKLFQSDDMEIGEDFVLYVSKEELESKKEYDDLLKMINCIIGESYFRISIRFQNGNSNLLLML